MITAIISEFNPITKGHAHIIAEGKKHGSVVCLMSGNFVQRGEGSILPKHTRGKMAISAGADLVLELPVHFACSNAETFAYGSVKMLSLLGVDRILFGSECGDIEKLTQLANFKEDEYFKVALGKNLAKGSSFPKAKNDAYQDCGLQSLISPNDILGVEYIKAGLELGFKGEFATIKRFGANHDSNSPQNGFASASHIRELVSSGKMAEAREFMPKRAFEILHDSNIVDCSALGILASYQGIMGKNRMGISEVSEGLENLMFQTNCGNFSDYTMQIKSKRYTLAKIKRMCVKSVLNISADDVEFAKQHIKFAKVLAVKKDSTHLFARKSKLQLLTRGKEAENLGKKQMRIYTQMQKADMVYSLFSGKVQNQMEVCT